MLAVQVLPVQAIESGGSFAVGVYDGTAAQIFSALAVFFCFSVARIQRFAKGSHSTGTHRPVILSVSTGVYYCTLKQQ